MTDTAIGSGLSSHTPSCNLCGSPDAALRFQKNGYNIVRCKDCGMVYVVPLPTPSQLDTLYGEAYFQQSDSITEGISYCDYESEADVLLPNFRARLNEIERFVPKGRILDVGCAYGLFLKVAQNGGWEAWGIELSAYAANYARHKLGLQVIHGDLLQADLPRATFDAITLWDTIEHLVDPLGVLRRAHALLRPGGIVAVGTDDVNSLVARLMGRHWYAFYPPWHTHHFSQSTLAGALQRAGLEVLGIGHPGKLFELQSIAARLTVFYPGRFASALHYRLARSCLGKRRIYINRGDWMVAYARKLSTIEQ